MRVFVTGATGAIGTRLVPQLVARGHEVIGTSRSDRRAAALREPAPRPCVLDVLDRDAVRAAVAAAMPDGIVHEATALGRRAPTCATSTTASRSPTGCASRAPTTCSRPPRELGVARFVAQSYAGWPYARIGGAGQDRGRPARPVAAGGHARDARRDPPPRAGGASPPAASCCATAASTAPPNDVQLELGAASAASRWSATAAGCGRSSTSTTPPRPRCWPSRRARRAIYNVVDDEPAPVREWLPALAEALGAKPPRHVPRWLGRLAAGEAGVTLMTESRGASNGKARRELGWTPRHPSWRRGFQEPTAC